MLSETELIQRALAGDSEAYGSLVEQNQQRLYSAMLKVTGSHDEAEDVVQETFVQAYLKLDTFQGNSRFFTWIYRIAFNNALSRGRKRRPNVSIEQSREVAGTDPIAPEASPDAGILQNERVDLVHRGLALLSDEHWQILMLREMEDLSYEDIAEVLTINIGTVRSRLSRARNQLKAQLELLDEELLG